MISYDKRPWYPFSLYTTKGILPAMSDAVKEWTTTAVLLIANLALGYQTILSWFSKG